MKSCNQSILVAVMAFAMLLCGSSTVLAGPSYLGTAQDFAVLGATPSVTNTGTTTIWGDVGISPALSITGKSSMTVNGVSALISTDIHEGDAVALQAQSDALAAYTTLAAMGYPPLNDLTGVDLAGKTLTPGVYHFDTTAGISFGGILTLDFSSDPDGDFVFQIGTALTTAASTSVNVIGGNPQSGVYWLMGVTGGSGTGAATLGSSTVFAGNILALDTISLNSTAAILCGRAISLNAAVTMIGNTISNDNTAENYGTGRSDFGSYGFSGGSPTIIPAPGAFILAGIGMTVVGWFRRRRTI